MNAEQLQELAINARLNHWPPHLGVVTDAEKMEYLARQAEEMAGVMAQNEELLEQSTTAQEEIAMDERIIEELRGEVYDLRQTIKGLEAKLNV